MSPADGTGPGRDLALVELVNRVMDRGVVISGEVVVSVADIDLLYLNLNLLVAGVETLRPKLEPVAPVDTVQGGAPAGTGDTVEDGDSPETIERGDANSSVSDEGAGSHDSREGGP